MKNETKLKIINWRVLKYQEPIIPIFKERRLNIQTACAQLKIDELEFKKRKIQTQDMVKREICNLIAKELFKVNAIEISSEKEDPNYPMCYEREIIIITGKLNYLMPIED